METPRPWHAGHQPGADQGIAAADARSRELAEAELRAAIAIVSRNAAYRVIVCGMATDARLVAGLDRLAAAAGVVLERRIRPGGGLDVVVRST